MATETIGQILVYSAETVKKNLITQIISVCRTINVVVYDHVIIGVNEYCSLKSNMLL